jgi:two-component system, sensor histidine kinase and response regulator
MTDATRELRATAQRLRAGIGAYFNSMRHWPIAIALVAIAFITIGAIYFRYAEIEALEAARVESVAESHAREISNWLHHRMSETEFVRTSSPMAGLFRKWVDEGDSASRDFLMLRLIEYRQANEYHRAALADANGEIVAREESGARPTPPELKAAARLAIAAGVTQRTTIYHNPGGHAEYRLDFVIPLIGEGLPVRGAAVLRINAEDYLFPLLKSWPVASHSAESLLVRREGDTVTMLSGMRHRPDMPGTYSVTNHNLLSVRATHDNQVGHAIKAVDYRGVSVLGVAYAVAGTDWLVIAKIDRSEIAAMAAKDAVWIALTGLLAMLAAGSLGGYFSTQAALRAAAERNQDQAERLRALQLLDAIAESSNDAIFAKDRDGRYLMFNREACRVTGKSSEEVVGRDDFSLFTPAQADIVINNDKRVMATGQAITYEESVRTIDGDRVFLATKGPIRDGDGEIVGMYGISRDITDRLKTERAIRESAQLLQSVQNSIPDALAVIDREGRILAVNTEWQRNGDKFCGADGARMCAASVGVNYLDACTATLFGCSPAKPATASTPCYPEIWIVMPKNFIAGAMRCLPDNGFDSALRPYRRKQVAPS